MTRLADALTELGLQGEVTPSRRFARLRGERGFVFVTESVHGGFFSWCNDPAERSVQRFADPVTAIEAGLRRAAHRSVDE